MFERSRFDRSLLPELSLVATGAGMTVASVVVSLLSYGILPSEVRIRWTLGGPHYGPEFAPAWLALAVFPVLVGALAVGAHRLKTFLAGRDEYGPLRGYYELGTLAVLGVVVLSQCLLVVANL